MFWKSCYDVCYSIDPIVTHSYLCAKNNKTDEPHGAYFGGIYTDNAVSHITGDKTCPVLFRSYTLVVGNPGMRIYVCILPFDAGKLLRVMYSSYLFSYPLKSDARY